MKQLLLLIDLQQGWRHKITEPAMLNAVALAKRFPGDTVHCCFKNDPNSLFHSQLSWQRFTETSDTDQIPEVKPLKLPVYWRSTYSCLNGQTLPLVKQYGRVYIAGVFTDISVFVTALDIFDQGVPVGVVTDCVASLHGQAAHQTALKSLDIALGSKWLVTADQIGS